LPPASYAPIDPVSYATPASYAAPFTHTTQPGDTSPPSTESPHSYGHGASPTYPPPAVDPYENAPVAAWGSSFEPTRTDASRDEPVLPAGQPREGNWKVLKIVSGVLTFTLVACLALIVKGGFANVFNGFAADSPTYPTTAPSSGVSATGTAKTAPTGPFQDTPAERYPQGEAGITLPAATAVPGFTAAQVGAKLQQVRQALIAARLDSTMVVSRDPSTLLGQLSVQSSKEIKPYFDKKDFFGFASQVAPGFTLTADPIRVSGEVTFRGSTENGVRLLEVVTNFVWVYPFSGELEQPGDHLVVVHDEVHWNIPVESDVDKPYRGLRLSSWDGFASNMDCALLKDSLLGLGKPKLVAAGATADDNSAFDPSRSLNIASTC
jgi:hypothetical protein